jgi:hypothetical protein
VSILTTLCEGFYTIPVGDKSYLVKSLIDKDVQADYARWHMMVVTQELADSRAMYTEEEFNEERALVRKNHRNGQYDFKSKLGAERLATESGMMFIVGRLVQDLDPSKVKEFLVEAGSPMVDLINAIIKDSFPEMLKISAKKKAEAEKAEQDKQGREEQELQTEIQRLERESSPQNSPTKTSSTPGSASDTKTPYLSSVLG